MSPGTLVVVIFAAGAALAVVAYWSMSRGRDATRLRTQSATFLLFTLGLIFCGWSLALEQPALSYMPQDRTVAIAVAFDLSPSMLAIPDPLFERDFPPRYARARETLLQLFRALQERRINVLVALVGFTQKAEIMMGWDDSPSQLREILQYGLSPDLFTSSGTRIEAAVETLVDVFGMLPEEFRETSRKVAILASDGEDTLPRSYLGYALEELAESSFDVVALQTGLLDTSEGVPRYGQVGEFLGFEIMSGRHYTVPDVELMSTISGATTESGLYIRAEDPEAVERILQFVGDARIDRDRFDSRLLVALCLFAVVALLCARVLK